MIEPRDYFVDRLHGARIWRCGPAQHDDFNAESARGGDLAVACSAAAVFGDHRIDRMRAHELALVGLAKWSAIDEIADARQRQRRLDRIDTADQIKMLRRFCQRREFTAAERDKDPARPLAQGAHRIGDRGCFAPAIAGDRAPWWTAQPDQRHAHLARRARGIGRDDVGIRMRRVDERIDPLLAEIFGKPGSAAEAAAANRHRLPRRRFGAAGQRHHDLQVRALGQTFGQLSRFHSAAEDKDA